jgi:hypothetical protein
VRALRETPCLCYAQEKIFRISFSIKEQEIVKLMFDWDEVNQRQRYDIPIINFFDDWQNQINHLLTQEASYNRKLRDEVKEELRGLGLKEQII